MAIDSVLNESTRQLLYHLQQSFAPILFGGVVRDFLWGYGQQIRDVDIVLKCNKDINSLDQRRILESAFTIYYDQAHRKRNRFGGYKLIGDKNKDIDIWFLQDTWAFREGILPASEENLLQSVYLNIDAYAYDYTNKQYINRCDYKVDKTIDIVLEKSFCEEVNLIRAVCASQKYNMNLSDRIVVKLQELICCWDEKEEDIKTLQRQHYGKILLLKGDFEKAIEG